ncbi:MAG: tetratricopeptide repeat protein [Crocinitomicaceae bacterium]|nr:tetratricopeptide repeat protein [Crocinitomicaceae bacterium]
MNKSYFYILVVLFLTYSCGTKKAAEDIQPSISKADYPYITKFHKGLRLKVTGRIDEALVELEGCLEIRQDDDALYYALSKLELQKGNEEKSAIYIQKAAELDPDNTWYIQELAYMFFERKVYAKAVENFEKLVEIEPRNVDWLYGYAEALVHNGEVSKAIDALNKTEDRIGKHPDLTMQKYKLYMSIKETDKAEQELLNVRDLFPKDAMIIATLVDHYFKLNRIDKAVNMLEELVEADPNNGRAHLALADVFQQRGDKVRMYEELKLAFTSTDVDIDTKMKILINFHESKFNIDKEVFELVDIMVEMYPEEAKAHSIHGDFLLRANDDAKALDAYKTALSLDKSQYPIWNQVLIMEYQAKDYENLYTDSKECLTMYPTIATVYLLNGISANQLGHYAEALEVLTIGKEMILHDPSMEAEFYGQEGEANFGLKAYNAAIKKYQKAIQLDPTSTLLKNNFARHLATAKLELDLAESLAVQATDLSPNQVIFRDTYGWVLFQKGEYEKANAQFKKAFELDETYPAVIDHLGDVLIMQGKKEDAVAMWKKAKALLSGNKVLDKKIAEKKYYDPEY